MKNKSGGISITLSWFAATIIVFFIILGGLFFEGTIISAKKGFSSDNSLQFKGVHDAAIEREFVSFLDSKINFEGKDMRVVDLISDKYSTGNEKYFTEFQKQGKSFMNKFSNWQWFSSSGFATYNSTYGNSWIRVYDASEKTEEYYSPNQEHYPSAYIIESTPLYIGAPKCNPFGNSLFFEIFISSNKRVALCMEYKQ